MSGRLDEERKDTNNTSSPDKKMSISAYHSMMKDKYGSDWKEKMEAKESHVQVTNLLEGENLEDGELAEAPTGGHRRISPKTPEYSMMDSRRRQNSPGSAYTPPHGNGSPRHQHSSQSYSQLPPTSHQPPHPHRRSRSPPRGPPPHERRRSRSHSRGPPPHERRRSRSHSRGPPPGCRDDRRSPPGARGSSRNSRSRSRSRSMIHGSRGSSPHSPQNRGPPPPGFRRSPGRGRSSSRSRGSPHARNGSAPRSPRSTRLGSRGASPHNDRSPFPPRGGDGLQLQPMRRSRSPYGRLGSPRNGVPRQLSSPPRGNLGSPRNGPHWRSGSPPRDRPGSPMNGPLRSQFNDTRGSSPPRSPRGDLRNSRSPRRHGSPRHERPGGTSYRSDGPRMSPRAFHPGARASPPRNRFGPGGPGSPREGKFGSPHGFPGGSPRGSLPPRSRSPPRFDRRSPPRSPDVHRSPQRSRSPGGRPPLRRAGPPPPGHRSMSRGRSRSRSPGPNHKRERSWERHGPPPPLRGPPSSPPPPTQMFLPTPMDWGFELQKSGKFTCRCRGIAASLPVNIKLPSVFNIVQLPPLSKFQQFLLMDRREVKRSVYEILPDGPANKGGYTHLRDYLLRGRGGIPRAGIAFEVEHLGYKAFILPPGQAARILGYMADQMILVFRQKA